MSLDDVARLQHLLREYLEYGGFPEVVFEEVEKDRILKEYTEMMLYKDVVERHRLRSLGLAKFLLGFFLQNFAREFSVNKVLRVVGEQFGKTPSTAMWIRSVTPLPSSLLTGFRRGFISG
jgi:predicted AAA+ superfamily ATPase